MKESQSYARLISNIMRVSVLQHPPLCVLAVVAALLTFVSTYYTVKISSCMGRLSETFKTDRFGPTLRSFAKTSLVALTLRYVPMLAYTFVLQTIMRREFLLLLRRYLNLSYTRFHSRTPGKLRYCIFVRSVCTPMCTQTVVFEFAKMIGMITFSVAHVHKDVSTVSACMFLVVPVVYLLAVTFFISRRIVHHRKYLVEQESISSAIYDKLIAYDAIKTFNLESTASNELYNEMKAQTKRYLQMGRFTAAGEYALNFILYMPFVLVLWLFLGAGTVSGDRFFGIVVLYTTMSDQLEGLGSQLVMFIYFLTQVKFTDVEPCESEAVEQEEMHGFHESIELRDVTLLYGERPVVCGINAIIRKGEKIAVIGPNGTGKSTFVKTLVGFTEFQGELLFDGRSTKELKWRSILQNIAYVPQQDYTSDDSVMNNLRLGDARASDAFIYAKAREFGAHEAFEKLPQGYETRTGPRGCFLSGGQLQKISLVRAAVKDAPVYILDEATAAMDRGYENELMNRLFKCLSDRTLIMIVHGKQHLSKFDRIFFFNDGVLEQTGPYEELLRTNANFRLFTETIETEE